MSTRLRLLTSFMRGSVCELLLALFFAVITSVHGDPLNLIVNGHLEWQSFIFGGFTDVDILHDGEMEYIPCFTVVHGGVQLLNTHEYISLYDGGLHGMYILHLNYFHGPGVLQTLPIVTPRKGATYNFTFNIADNPDGGPLFKAVSVKILVNNRLSSVNGNTFEVSSPYSTRETIVWHTVGFTFVGTGESTIVQLESLVPGPFGALVDNLNVTLVNLVDNGSFEIVADGYVDPNITYFNVLASPSFNITGWAVTSGKIKRVEGLIWQPSTDDSPYMLDLNAEGTAGAMSSNPFTTKPGMKYKVLYDTTVNPQNAPALRGAISASVVSKPGGKVLASRSVVVDGKGFSPSSMGWLTYVLEFKALETMAVVEFMSLMAGSLNGPLLDNVVVYEVCRVENYKSVKRTFSSGTSVKPSIWVTILASSLVIYFSRCSLTYEKFSIC